jgi:phosphohistidine phosphatase SixA
MTSYLVLLRHANAVAKEVDASQPLDVDGLVSASTAGVELSAIFAGYGIHTARLWHSKATRSKQTADQLVKVRG